MKIGKITIGRLFNLGNYEHIRFELTVDVGPNDSAEAAITAIENLLPGLNPKRPAGVPSESDLAHAAKTITTIEGMPDNDVAEQYGRSKGLVLHDFKEKLKAGTEKANRWKAAQARARQLFDDLGGASQFTDAKANWIDDQDYEF